MKRNKGKDCFYFIAKLVIIVALLLTVLPSWVEANELKTWSLNTSDNKWYIFKGSLTSSSGGGLTEFSARSCTYDIFIPNCTCYIKSTFKHGGITKVTYYLKYNNEEKIKDTKKNGVGEYKTRTMSDITINGNWSTNSICYGWEYASNGYTKEWNVSIPLPEHCDVPTTDQDMNYGTVELNSTNTKQIEINSFLTNSSTTGITIESSNPTVFKINNTTNSSATICSGSNQAYCKTSSYITGGASINSNNLKIYFQPTAFGNYSGTITIKNGSDVVKTLNVSATCAPSYTWSTTTLALRDYAQPASVNGYNGTIYYQSSDTNVIKVIQNGTKLLAVGAGNANITASVDNSQVTDTKTITVTNLGVQVIDWSQNFMRLKIGTTTLPITLTAVAKDRDSGNATGCGITYTSSDNNVVTVSGNQITAIGAGEATLTATAAGSASYASAVTQLPVKVRAAGDNSCSEFVLQVSTIESTGLHTFASGKTPGYLSFTNHWDSWRNTSSTIYEQFADGSRNQVSRQEYSAYTEGSQDYASIAINRNAVGLYFDGSISEDDRWYTNIKVTQASFLESAITGNTFAFGQQGIGTSHQETISAVNYSNLNEEIDATITGTNADQFTLNTQSFGNGCGEEGVAAFSVTYNPTSGGSHTATLHLEGKISSQTVSVDITLTGSGTKLSQTITWEDQANLTNLNANSTKPDNGEQTNPITLTASTDAVHGTDHLVITYTSSDPSIANVINGQLYIYKAGTVTITASQPGDNTYNAASENKSKTLVIAKATPNLSWVSQLDNSTPVFSTQTVEAQTTDNEGAISYSISGDAMSSISGNQVSLRNCVPITVTATKAATDVYSGTSVSYTFTPSKVTPTVYWSGSEITGTTFTATTYLECSSLTATISNSDDLWHDISVEYRSSDSDVAELQGNHFYLKKEGTCQITAYVSEGGNNNASNEVSYTLTVVKSPQSITWNLSDDESAAHYINDVITLTASSPANNVTYTASPAGVVTINDNQVTCNKAGYVTITAHSATTPTYLAASDVSKDFVFGIQSSATDFGNVTVGGASAEQTFDLSNLIVPKSGTTHYNIYMSSEQYRILDGGQYKISLSDDKISRAVGESVSVKYYPLNTTDNTATLYIEDDDRTYQIPLSGTPQANTISCGNIYVGNASATTTINLTDHTGDVTVSTSDQYKFRIYQTTEDGTNPQQNITVPTGTNSYGLKFCPNFAGTDQTATQSATLTVSESVNGHAVQYTISVSGTAMRRLITFGTHNLGVLEAEQTIELSNMGSGFSVTSVVPQVFRVNNQATATQDVAGNSFTVKFIPQSTTTYNSNITVTEKSTGQTYTIYLTGGATANSTMSFTTTPVSETASETGSITLSNFDDGYEFDVMVGSTSVVNSFPIDNSPNVQALTNGTHTIKFNPQETSTFNGAKLYAREISSGALYPLADISATSTKKTVTLEWIDTSDPIVLNDGACKSGFARVKENPNLVVYYTTGNNSIVAPCDQDVDHTGYYKGVQAISLGTTTITATFLSNANYELAANGEISKSITVSSKTGQTILGIADSLSFATGASPVTLSAYAVSGRDGTTETGKQITYSIEDAANKTDVVTLSGTTLTIVGKGNATLLVSAAGDETYEATTKRVGIEVYVVGECGTQYVVNEGAKSDTWTGISSRTLFEQTYPISKPVDKIMYMQSQVTRGNLHVTIKYKKKGESSYTYIQNDLGCLTAGSNDKWDVTSEQTLPEEITEVYYKLNSPTSTEKYSISALQITQKKYFRESQTSVDFGESQYLYPVTNSNISAAKYSALDKNEVTWSIDGTDSASFTLNNPGILKGLACDAWGEFNLSITFTPKKVGVCNATLHLTAKVDGAYITKNIELTGTGTKRTQTIEWSQNLDDLTVADRNVDKELTAASSIKNETLPITYSITSGSDNALLVTNNDKTYLRVIKAGSVTITATQAGTANIQAANASRTFTIGATTQMITWEKIDDDNTDSKTIYTSESTTAPFVTLKARAIDAKGYNTGMLVRYEFNVTGCGGATFTQLLDTARDANDDLTVKYKGGGSATITVTASQPGDKVNYSASTENKTKTIVIAKTTPTMQWTTSELSGHYYGDVVAMTPTRTPLLGNDNTYSYTFENITNGDLVAVGNDLQIKKAVSNATVKANKVEDCWNTATTTPASQTVSFDKAPQLIKWNQDLNSINAGKYNTQITFDAYSIDERHSTTDAGGNNVDTWKTRNSNGEVAADGAITYSVTFVSAEAGCSLAYTLNNNVLTITDAVAGEVTVTASCAASDNYAAAAATVVKTFTIDKITPTVSGLVNGGNSVVYNPNAKYPLTGSASGDNYSSIDAAEFTYTVESGNATISGTELTTTGAGSATIQVTKRADCYVDATAGTFTVTITRATPDFTFTAAPTSVAYGTTATYTAASTAVSDGTVTYEIASGSDCAEINCSTGVVTPRKVGTFTVKATLAESTNHTSAEVTTAEISIVKGTPTLNITGNDTMNRYETQKLTFVTNSSENGAITLSSSDENVVSVNEHSITALGQPGATATITATMAATDNWNSQTATIGITVATGTLHFVGSENSDGTEWFNTANWSPRQVIPESADNVVIEHECVVSGNAVCNELSFATNGSLAVDSNAVLSAGTINNEDADKLLLKATLNHSASVLFTSGSPKATVECWFRGKSTKTVDGNDTTMTPEWQYRGFIGNPDSTRWPVRKVLVYAWDESANGWDTGDNGDRYVTKGSSWTGYSMGNTTTNTMTLTYTTELIPTNEPETLNLAKSTTGKGKGLNLVTNSFSAPVLIDDITFTNATEEIVFFRTNSYENVKNELSGTGTTTEKINSLYVTCPKNTTKVLGKDTIPAGSSFFCLATATSGSSITLPVPVQSASGAMYAPRHTDEFNVLKIYAESENERDEVYLVESDNCTHNYDNGYDGTKYFTDGMGQIYGKNDFGRTFIAADSSMLGQMIGFRAGSNDMTYRLRFDIERLSGYDELYLYDRVTKRYTDILDGGTYEFIGTTDGEDERFQILGKRTGSDTFNTGSDHAIEVIADRALLKGFDGENQTIYLTDLNGTTVWSDNAQNGPWFNLPTNLPAGIYIIHCGDATAKYLIR